MLMVFKRLILLLGITLFFVQGCALIMNPKLLKTPIPVLKMMGGASDGNIDEVKLAVLSGVSVNARMVHNSVTALHIAAGKGNVDIVSYLLEQGADPNLRTTIQFDLEEGGIAAVGGTPLLYAVAKRHPQVVKLLLDALANPNARTLTTGMDENGKEIPAGITPMNAALGKKGEPANIAMMKILLERGADPNTAFPAEFKFEGNMVPAGTNLLITAAYHNKLDALTLLLESGADPNAASDVGVTALLTAVGQGNMEMVRLLLDYGADPNKKTTRRFENKGIVVNPGATPLMSVAYRGNYELASLLLERGATDPEGIAFQMAHMKHDRKMMDLIGAAQKTK